MWLARDGCGMTNSRNLEAACVVVGSLTFAVATRTAKRESEASLAKDSRYRCSSESMAQLKRWVVVAACAWVAACGGDGSSRLRVGREGEPSPDASGSGGGGAQPSGGSAGVAGTGTRDALSVRVADLEDMTIEVVALSCEGECADVRAVARGGNPPYAIEWSDGETSPERRVCPSTTTVFEVTASDTPITTEEFAYPSSRSTARVTAQVLECATDGGSPDAAIDPGGRNCIDLERFDNEGFPPWTRCPPSPELRDPSTGEALAICEEQVMGSPRIESHARFATYDGAPVEQETLSGEPCEPLEGGVRVDLGLSLLGSITSDGLGFHSLDTTVDVELWGSDSLCDKSELLWSVQGALLSDFNYACISFTPTRDHPFLHAVTRFHGPAGFVRHGCMTVSFGSGVGVCP